MKKVPLIYIAGAYSAPDRSSRIENIGRAKALARQVVEAGGYARCPHIIGDICDDLHDWKWWMDATSRDLSGCDAAIVVPQSAASRGTQLEIAQCAREGRPVFYSISELRDWMARELLPGRPWPPVPDAEKLVERELVPMWVVSLALAARGIKGPGETKRLFGSLRFLYGIRIKFLDEKEEEKK